MTPRRKDRRLFEAGESVAILGLGASGTAAARLVHALGGRVYASDAGAGERQTEAAEGLRAEGIDAEAGRHDVGRILGARLVVTSPGIDPSSEVRQAVAEARVRTVAEVEVAARHVRSRVIGITGTNGKTTTTALCGHLLREAGLEAITAGNIGRPLSEVAILEHHPEWVVVELSSFQLADLETFTPNIGMLLNLAPDHLDRYSSLERYYADKARLFANATDDSLWVLNGEDDAVGELIRSVPGARHFAALAPHDQEGAFLDAEGWLCRRAGDELERWLRAEDLRLLGRHNVMNALIAGLGAALAGCAPAAIGRGLASFEGLPHRLRPVGEFERVLWINDSKGTNLSATKVALESFDRPLVVVLGGRHKGEPYTSLLPSLEGARGVVAFGEAAPLIVRHLADRVPLEVANGLEEAITRARSLAQPGDVVLFSPACSSYDMFPSYAVRGDSFEATVRTLYRDTEVG